MCAQVKLETDTQRFKIAGVMAQRLRQIVETPQIVIDQVHKEIMAEVPVYTGTYRGGVKTETEVTPASVSASVYVSRETLTESAARHPEPAEFADKYPEVSPSEYAGGQTTFVARRTSFRIALQDEVIDEDFIYPERIEEQGSPVQGEAQGLWHRMAAKAKAMFFGTIRSILRFGRHA